MREEPTLRERRGQRKQRNSNNLHNVFDSVTSSFKRPRTGRSLTYPAVHSYTSNLPADNCQQTSASQAPTEPSTMSWSRTARACKTAAARNISLMATEQALSPGESNPGTETHDSSPPKFLLKFQKAIWNAYTPPSLSSPSPKTGQKRKRTIPPVSTDSERASKARTRSPAHRQCKVKLTRFYHGGPARLKSGEYQNLITLSTPCLQASCATCWKYHAHLMRLALSAPAPGESHREDARTAARRRTAPAESSPVDMVREASQVRPRLTLKLRVTAASPAPSPGNNPLPTPSSAHTTPTSASATPGREEHRQRYTARLRFSSDAGRAKFTALVHMQILRETHSERARLGRVSSEADPQALRSAERGEGRPRRRHRVRSAFGSEAGREEYRRVPGMYLR